MGTLSNVPSSNSVGSSTNGVGCHSSTRSSISCRVSWIAESIFPTEQSRLLRLYSFPNSFRLHHLVPYRSLSLAHLASRNLSSSLHLVHLAALNDFLIPLISLRSTSRHTLLLNLIKLLLCPSPLVLPFKTVLNAKATNKTSSKLLQGSFW